MNCILGKVAIGLALISLLHTAKAIKCWECRSDSDPKCGDPFDNITFPIWDCAQEPELKHLKGVRPTLCRKIRQKMHGEWRYFRSCAYMGEPCSHNRDVEECEVCDTDLCNSSVRPAVIGVALLLTAALAHILL